MEAPSQSARETRVIEANAVALGVSIETLMENAGRAVAEEAARHLQGPSDGVAVLAGTGNNGGDGFAAVHYLRQWGFSPDVWLLAPPAEIRSSPARRCYERIAPTTRLRVGVPRPQDLTGYSLLIDAMLGTGQHGEPRPPVRDAVVALASSTIPILSVDEPTGLGSAVTVRPRWTVALESVKEGMTSENCGEILVRPNGIPLAAVHETGPGVFLFYPLPEKKVRSPRNGRILVVGGGPYAGAPALAGLAVLRSGAERAVIAVPSPAATHVQSFSPNLIVHPVGAERFLPSDVATLLHLADHLRVDAVIVGMGVGDAPESATAMADLVERLRSRAIPLVVDADALGALGPVPAGPERSAPCVATPNRHEFDSRFLDLHETMPDSRLEAARRIAGERRITLLAKDEVDLLTDGTRAYLNRHHHPAMTVGGTGDVLAGVVGSLLGRGVGALDAARLAAYWVGEAGLRAFSLRSWGLLATDVIDELPGALRDGLARVER
ncbi:MAG TPA: NAD(P)H-hydrate dehydratase [Thermoplasmata archaeon]|nr:NAD(P)H-hydrate dehydratase [Thermoplasmata archaeon]